MRKKFKNSPGPVESLLMDEFFLRLDTLLSTADNINFLLSSLLYHVLWSLLPEYSLFSSIPHRDSIAVSQYCNPVLFNMLYEGRYSQVGGHAQ